MSKNPLTLKLKRKIVQMKKFAYHDDPLLLDDLS